MGSQAVEGRRLWHENNCQVCHQLFGQGGFLGPDLTNAASRMDAPRLRSLLTIGSGQMPAYGLDDAQIAQVAAFLEYMDKPEIGRGQLRLGDPEAEQGDIALFTRAVEANATPQSPEFRGFAAFSSRACAACHQPFRVSVVGAPDLSVVSARLSADELRTVLIEGQPSLGMPPPTPAFSEQELGDVIQYLTWLESERDIVQGDMAGLRERRRVDWSALPWWTFE